MSEVDIGNMAAMLAVLTVTFIISQFSEHLS
jgi:hypothetical protein